MERMLNMRFEGMDTNLMVLPKSAYGELAFELPLRRMYKTEFGFLREGSSIMVGGLVDDIKVCTDQPLPLNLRQEKIGSWSPTNF